MSPRRPFAVGLALISAGTLAACSDSSSGGGTVDLAGTYTIVSVTIPPNPTIAPPAVSGDLTITATDYATVISVDFPAPGTAVIADTGTYSLSGSLITLHSNTGLGTSTGPYSFNTSTKNLTITLPLAPPDSESVVWHKL